MKNGFQINKCRYASNRHVFYRLRTFRRPNIGPVVSPYIFSVLRTAPQAELRREESGHPGQILNLFVCIHLRPSAVIGCSFTAEAQRTLRKDNFCLSGDGDKQKGSSSERIKDRFRQVVFAQSPSPDWAKNLFSAHSASLRLSPTHTSNLRS